MKNNEIIIDGQEIIIFSKPQEVGISITNTKTIAGGLIVEKLDSSDITFIMQNIKSSNISYPFFNLLHKSLSLKKLNFLEKWQTIWYFILYVFKNEKYNSTVRYDANIQDGFGSVFANDKEIWKDGIDLKK
jgi:hypothetical protein